jgi:HK97 family phage portal protein
MKLLGFEITRTNKGLVPAFANRGGWMDIIREGFPGAWQRNVEINRDLVTSFYAVFACMTLISRDISKLYVDVIKNDKGVWSPIDRSPFVTLLNEPNTFQNHNQFWENWMLSKLMRGNTYVLKRLDASQRVAKMTVLDPNRVSPLVSESGEVFYQLDTDNLSGVFAAEKVVPATAIIHDRWNCLFHPLIGLSPIYAAGLAATMGLTIQNNSTSFFNNRSIPGGILTTPNTIPDSTAQRLKDDWNLRSQGDNQGKTMVLGDGLEFKAMAVTATDAQMLEQMKASAEWVCTAFHVPPYKIGIGQPLNNNVQSLNLEYYSQALQSLIEDAETCLSIGLGMKPNVQAVRFDLDGLLRMDTVSQIQSIKDAITAGIMSPNEGRSKIDLPPVKGGESPMSQQQNYSLAALAERDADKPFAKPEPAPAAAPAQVDDTVEENPDDNAQPSKRIEQIRKGWYSHVPA